MNYLLFYIGVIVVASAQIFLKMSADWSKQKKRVWYVPLFTGYLLMFLVTLLNLYLFKYLPAKIMITAPAGTYFFVNIFSYFIFKEKDIKSNIFENFLILIGIVIFCLGK